MKTNRKTEIALAAIMVAAPAARGQDALGTLEGLTVIGTQEDIAGLPGSGFVLTGEEIRETNFNNINRLLARVPGVYVREEDGYGNFPNISIRGGDGTRSEKVTVMEDGILTAPAPYSAPGAYYSPSPARMSSIEVLKGSSQVRYGPQTTGGVLNYISTAVPEELTFYTRNTYGTDNTILSHTYLGDTVETEAGRFGYLAELFFQGSDGFRTVDPGAGGAGTDESGFQRVEPMLKLFWEPDSVVPQRFEFKYGYTNFDSDETYIGLSEEDVRATPDRRYAGTRFDNFKSEQHRTYLKHIIEPNECLKLETALYFNHFTRNWAKVDDAALADTNGDGFLNRDDSGSVRRYLLDGGAGLALLQGRGPGALILRNNNRDYQAYGAQLGGLWEFETGPAEHELGFGARYHQDYERRFQNDENIILGGTGGIARVDLEAPGGESDRLEESEAVALWIQDRIGFGPLAITPGLRYESISQDFEDYNNGQSGENSFDLVSPGVSVNYAFAGASEVFAGVYRGYAIPSPRDAARDLVEEEKSIGYELGARTTVCGVNAELVGFFTDFSNLISTDAGFGSTNDSRNVGEAEVWGVESIVRYDPLADSGADMALPVYLSATWTSAELKSEVAAGGGEDIYSGGTDGSDIPYVPEWKIAAGVGFTTGPWGANLDMTYTSKTFGTARNLDAPIGPGDSLGAREGKIDALLLFDFSTHYQLTENFKLLGGVANLFDERGIVSRIPRGPRANNGRTAYVGFEALF